jgi:hypothetical protein
MTGYHLPACVVLAAAVIGTRRAYHAATAILPIARSIEAEGIKDFSTRQVTDLEERQPQRKTSGNPKGRPRQKEKQN